MVIKQKVNKAKEAWLNFLNLIQTKETKSKIFLKIQDNKMNLTQKINKSSHKIQRKKTRFLIKNLTNHLNLNQMSQERMKMNHQVAQWIFLSFQEFQAYKIWMKYNLMKLMLGKTLDPKVRNLTEIYMVMQ